MVHLSRQARGVPKGAGPTGRNVRRAARTLMALVTTMLLALALAGCSGAAASSQSTTPAAITATVASPSGTPTSTATIGPTPVEITDLNAFRAKLAAAFQSNAWTKVAPLLSPAFSFQGLDSGGASLKMPDSATDLRSLFTSGGPWTQGAQYEVNIHYCYAGSTPTNQQMGFDGGSGSFILAGIGRWQGYWVVAWAFQDPLGGSDGCASG